MFNFFKKKQTSVPVGLSDDRVFDLSLLISMFDSWSIDHGFGGLDKNDRVKAICTLLRQRGLIDDNDTVDSIHLGMISINPNYNLDVLRGLRAATGFDTYAVSFCESIELPDAKYLFKSENAKVNRETSKNLTAKEVIKRIAKTAWIYPSMKEGKIYFVIQILVNNDVFAGLLGEDKSELINSFIDLTDQRILNGFFDDPRRMAIVKHSETSVLNLQSERIVYSNNNLILFGWGTDPTQI